MPQSERSTLHEGFVRSGQAALWYRAIGRGPSLLVLHGGPDFDHTYLLPELDAVADGYRLIYYDQRGRGRSTAGVEPDSVTLQSEVGDIEALRQYFGLETIAVLGHSWGGLLALEYALRHPEHVSHLILLNTAPASHDDFLLLRRARRRDAAADLEQQATIAATTGYQAGDPDTVADYYRIHFRTTLRRPEQLESMVQRLRETFARTDLLKAWAIERRLMNETWLSNDYDLLPRLTQLPQPTLVLHGAEDLVPVDCAAHIAQAIPRSRLIVLDNSGHFSYLEAPDQTRKAIHHFFQTANG